MIIHCQVDIIRIQVDASATDWKRMVYDIQKEEELQGVRQQLRAKRSLIQMEELKRRKRVLRRLGYCNSDDVIELKGRIACELSAADELGTLLLSTF